MNSLTVFSCGLSYVSCHYCHVHLSHLLTVVHCSDHFLITPTKGMSLSLESMEIVRRTTANGILSVIKPRRLNTLVIGFITIGQLLGSSGGIMFLAEFVVTAISLLLGGAATVTSRALESWITFFCLASTSFWGFVFARLGLLDGMRKKRRGVPSTLLCASLFSAMTMWLIVLTRVHWYSVSPGSLVIVQAREFMLDMRNRASLMQGSS